MPMQFEGEEVQVPVNAYFVKYPEKALGTPHADGNMYGDEPGYGLTKGDDFSQRLKESFQRATTAAAAASVPAYREKVRSRIASRAGRRYSQSGRCWVPSGTGRLFH